MFAPFHSWTLVIGRAREQNRTGNNLEEEDDEDEGIAERRFSE